MNAKVIESLKMVGAYVSQRRETLRGNLICIVVGANKAFSLGKSLTRILMDRVAS